MARLLDDLLDVSRISRNKLELRRQRIELAPSSRMPSKSAARSSRPAATRSPSRSPMSRSNSTPTPSGWPRCSPTCSTTPPSTPTGVGGSLTFESRGWMGTWSFRSRTRASGSPPRRCRASSRSSRRPSPALERSQGGLGIGLSLVKGVVELHGGSVFAHSDGPGKGSEFIVRLPVASSASTEPERPDRTPSPAACEPQAAKSQCRILIADDNEDSADSLAMLLRIHGPRCRDRLRRPSGRRRGRDDAARRGAPRHRHAEAQRLRRLPPHSRTALGPRESTSSP